MAAAVPNMDMDFEYQGQEHSLNDMDLKGDITVPGVTQQEESDSLNTLDEPVFATIIRDLKAVGVKFQHVFYPKQNRALLRDWDLWGPLVLCLVLAILLQTGVKDPQQEETGVHFAGVVIVIWLGSVVVTLNSKLLGGTISFLQSVCVLGYCLLPLTLAAIACQLILLAQQSAGLFAVRLIIVLVAFGWSTFASTAFVADTQPSHRKTLACYPIFLFYFVVSWLILSHSH